MSVVLGQAQWKQQILANNGQILNDITSGTLISYRSCSLLECMHVAS